jgi:hypothetical protein
LVHAGEMEEPKDFPALRERRPPSNSLQAAQADSASGNLLSCTSRFRFQLEVCEPRKTLG